MSESKDYKPALANDAVMKASVPVPENFEEVHGVDYSKPESRNSRAIDLVKSMKTMGFQASNLYTACEIINEMRRWRGKNKSEIPKEEWKGEFDENGNQKATIFLGYTSNLISSGLRDTLRFLVQHKMVSAVVSSAGGIEEDIIKCLAPTYMGDFALRGKELRKKGLNRIGNMIIPNENYCKFEDFMNPVLDKMLAEQEASAKKLGANCMDDDAPVWTPSRFIDRLGKEINDETSVLYWAHKNQIPIFCPSLTDGSIGDMLFFHTFRASPKRLRVDIVGDIRRLNSISLDATRAGMILLGGGMIKHHICNSCLMRNGADWSVYINTGQEFDGSDAGARPDEAVSWGKIKPDAHMTKLYADVTTVFPLIVAATFASE
ncbi:Deoxyhypusine synthase [Brettanomyces bruxellensis]|uniref:Deoxyhypusine synthase n=1 Tax=Dekkera bruxellensis TaxID=5007 RepID=A0A8H6B855_DEKBR|nr:Deoxyhypusine synthase [Brettanomyces bruxellensis]EIF48138.1 deoxyhypusine synthase [Brettanomyces bruxellensis AWRI1499]KAF6006898.1 Deoxyhypusine synthase [Brettanomyces bruxellensis]QOU22666.1 Deoxyhypusine synthase [Brettanomyces bruxellensis]